jgi:hypothetical protein
MNILTELLRNISISEEKIGEWRKNREKNKGRILP